MSPEENQENIQPLETKLIEQKPRRYSFLLILTALLILTGIFGVWFFSSVLPNSS